MCADFGKIAGLFFSFSFFRKSYTHTPNAIILNPPEPESQASGSGKCREQAQRAYTYTIHATRGLPDATRARPCGLSCGLCTYTYKKIYHFYKAVFEHLHRPLPCPETPESQTEHGALASFPKKKIQLYYVPEIHVHGCAAVLPDSIFTFVGN